MKKIREWTTGIVPSNVFGEGTAGGLITLFKAATMGTD
jgi:hypothetical protein